MADNRESSETYVGDMASGPRSRTSSTADGGSYRSGLDRSTSDVGAEDSTRVQPRPIQSARFGSEIVRSPTSSEMQDRRHTRRPTGGRSSSLRQMPYRGQEFSVDDDPNEVDGDTSQQRRDQREAKPTAPPRKQSSTIRRRATQQQSQLRVPLGQQDSSDSDVEYAPIKTGGNAELEGNQRSSGEERRITEEGDDDDNDDNDDEDNANDDDGEDDDSGDTSDAESFTLKDRQQAINETHPFGIRVWKPALYKKSRSVEKNADSDIHSAPGGHVSRWLWFFNFTWTLVFGWWLALFAAVGGLLCLLFAWAPGCKSYGRVLLGFSGYVLYPFGKYLMLVHHSRYVAEDEGEGRTVREYEQWQSGALEEGRLFFGPVQSLVGRRRSDDDSEEDDESTSLLGRNGRNGTANVPKQKTKKRPFGRGKWNLGRVIYFVFFYGLLAPLLLLVSGLCWLFVFSIPMARVTYILFDQLRRRPLSLEFHLDSTDTRDAEGTPSSILLCTYRAVGTKYWKYTLDGTNIFLINLLGVVGFVIFDYWVLYTAFGLEIWLTNTILVFLLALFSIIPLAYFIGQAVASISAQSTMGVGAAVNAFFSTIVEVFLYCVALKEGKSQLVEGSIIGSIFAGVLFLPGLSMCFGAIRRKTQRFNVRSAGVTSTMLLFAVIALFGPTLFYQIFGSHEINCTQCIGHDGNPLDTDCQRCYFAQIPAVHDTFYNNIVRPYTWFAATLLFLSYIIGLFFTLRTHAAIIWHSDLDEKKIEKLDPPPHQSTPTTSTQPKFSNADYGAIPLARQTTAGSISKGDVRDSALYKRILGQSLKQIGVGPVSTDNPDKGRPAAATAELDDTAIVGQAASTEQGDVPLKRSAHLAEYDNQTLIRQMAEMAATAAAVAARDAQEHRKGSQSAKSQAAAPRERASGSTSTVPQTSAPAQGVVNIEADEAAVVAGETTSGGHDAPNWGRGKSYVVLLTATVAYAVIAEILVNTVDAVLDNVAVDQKFLGITLFALVPNTTEFLNAISFAVNGNIALSMEIGSAYALQVCLLQVPALVLFSACYAPFVDVEVKIDKTFSLIFPQWDMVTVILCVFLLSYMYGEGKSNYFKGSILILSYFVVLVGFFCTGYSNIDADDGVSGNRVMGGRTTFTRFRTNPSLRQDL